MLARFRFTVVTLFSAIGLMAWGAFVTSIDAGMAVPDWPSSFQSYDPFNPWPEWWTVTPVLAEHGHRLVGALVGLLTLILALWTVRSENRPWMKRIALGALGLVILQGVLGGMRVVWVSMDLAVVHAVTAQLFFALLASMALFTSASWNSIPGSLDPASDALRRTRLFGIVASGAVFVQIVLGALLRHPGTGIDPLLAGLHMGWALVALVLVLLHARQLSGRGLTHTAGRKWAIALRSVVLFQVVLGFVTYFVLLDEQGMLRPSNLQVVINSLHLVTAAILFGLNVTGVILTVRSSDPAAASPGSAL